MEIVSLQDNTRPVIEDISIDLQVNRDSIILDAPTSKESMSARRKTIMVKKRLCAKLRSPNPYLLFTIYTCIVILIGVLVICLTAREKKDHNCAIAYRPFITDTINQNSRPQSVVIRDMNNDKQLDIVVVTTGINSIKIFFGYGNGTFTNETIYSTGPNSYPYSIAVDDFNNDQCLDIAVTNYGTHNIGIYLGYCNGQFTNQTTYSTNTSQPIMITTGDINNDNYSDIIISNNGTDSIGVLLGYGNGTFGTIAIYSTGYDSFPYEIAVHDMNYDGNLDIIVTNYGTDNIGIHLGYGNGTFATQSIYSTGLGSRPYSVAINDMNKDNKLDIIVGNSGTGDIVIFFNYENESFTSKTILSTNICGPLQLVTGDINYDSYEDIGIISSLDNNIYVILGYDNGIFDDKIAYSTNVDSTPRSLALGDVNNDNRADVIVANYGTNNVGIFLGYDPAPFKNQTIYSGSTTAWPHFAILGDVNDDHILDIITANTDTDNIGIFFGYGNGSFTIDMIVYSTDIGSQPYSIAIGDINNDNRSDITVANSGTGAIGIFFGYGNNSFQEQIIIATFSGSLIQAIAVGDFNNDNRLDIVIADRNMSTISLFIGYGNGSFVEPITFSTGESSEPYSIAVADFNKDERLDIAVANFKIATIGIFLGNGDGNFTSAATYFTDFHRPTCIVTGDVNNDNRLDIILALYTDFGESAGLFLGNNDGTFETRMRYLTDESSSPYGVAVNDLNNDNFGDIVLANLQTGDVGILLSHGDGTFASQIKYATGTDSLPISVVLGDLNNDSRLDIVVTNYGLYNVGVFLGYSYGALQSPIIYSTGAAAKPESIILGDVNHDDRLDIVVANYGTNNIGLYVTLKNGTFLNETFSLSKPVSLPNSVIMADFNKDSENDLAVANFGQDNIELYFGSRNGTFGHPMSYPTGFGSQPCALVAGDFNNDSWQDLAISQYGASSIGVYLGYKYPNHGNQTIYSTGIASSTWSLSVGDLNSDSHSDIVAVNPKTNNIDVFLNYGNGTFRIPIVYSLDNGCQPISSAISDFNNDHQLDVIVICYSLPIISVFFGYGNGTLTTSPKISSLDNQFELREVHACALNNDSGTDIVLVRDSEDDQDHLIILFGNGDGTFLKQTSYSTGPTARILSASIVDINHDNQLDIVLSNNWYSNIGVFLGQANGTFANQTTYPTGEYSFTTSNAIGDLNNDNNLDIIVTNSDQTNVGIFFGYGNGSFADQKIYFTLLNSQYTEPHAVAIADFNNDHQLDFVVTFPGENAMALFLNYGNEKFEIVRVYSTGYDSYTEGIVIADFNHDSVPDIAVANSGTAHIGIFLGYCCDVFLQQTVFSTGSNSRPQGISTGDFNQDNILDIAVANQLTDDIGILLGYGNGTFADQTTYSTGDGTRPHSLAIGDFNNDNYSDIVVANYGNESIGFFFGYDNGAFENYTTYSTGVQSRPYAIAVLDFNQDNQLDIVVSDDGTNNIAIALGYGNGTFGSLLIYNTGYNSQPCALAVGDYINDNQTDIVVTECGTNTIGIISNFC